MEGVEITGAEQTADAVLLTTRNGARFHAPIVIAADGANSVIARRLGIRAAWQPFAVALDMMEETPFESLACVDPISGWCITESGMAGAYVFPADQSTPASIVLDDYRSTSPTRRMRFRNSRRVSACERSAAGESVRRVSRRR
jgi:flavin-dependent dehydrogenase